MNYDELKDWTVVLRSKIKGNLKSIISGYHVNITKRKAQNKNYNSSAPRIGMVMLMIFIIIMMKKFISLEQQMTLA